MPEIGFKERAMNEEIYHVPNHWEPEPRWPALVAIIAIAGIYMALPAQLTMGPRWLFPVTMAVLLAITIISHIGKRHLLNRTFGFIVSAVVTMAMVASLVLLIRALPAHKETPRRSEAPTAVLCVQVVLE